MRQATLLLVTLSAGARAVAAQDTLAIEPGERVRLTTLVRPSVVVGVLVTQDRDSLLVRPGPGAPPVAFPRADVASVEASLGVHGHAGNRPRAGLLAGEWSVGCWARAARTTSSVPVQVAARCCSGGTGLLFGALVGVFVRSERWDAVYPEVLGVTVLKTRRGLGVGLSIGF